MFKTAHKENQLGRRMRIYIRPKLLIIDKVGYLSLDGLGSNLFFQTGYYGNPNVKA